MDNTVILNVNGKPVSNADVIIYLKENSFYKNSLQDLIKLRAMQSYAEQTNLSITDEELQEYVNSKRKELGLLTTQSTQTYLSSLGITSDQWIESLENDLLKERIRDKVINSDAIDKYFNENKLQFVQVELYTIVCDNKDTAEELLMEVRDDKKDFFELARQYSIDQDTSPASGYMGRVKRGKLPINIEQKVFVSEENSIFGPIKTPNGFSIFRIGRIIMPELNDDLKNEIKSGLFDYWLNQLVQSVRIELPNN